VIAFVGSVFSPYYAWARSRGSGDPENHVAVNVALYGPVRRWTMTERGRAALARDAVTLSIGRSSLRWDGASLRIEVEEVGAPWPRPVRGAIRVTPEFLTDVEFPLDPAGRHRWRPIAPRAHVEAAFTEPAMSWSGTGYLDANAGDEPLEDAFASWTWSRAALGRGAAVLYDVERRDGSRGGLALRFDDGATESFPAPAFAALPGTRWLLPRATRSEAANAARLLASFEDTPFYARSLVETRLLGETVRTVHENLALGRFRNPVVRAMLPFRMPRTTRVLRR
jgi:carotenoid 1,2-hydratase